MEIDDNIVFSYAVVVHTNRVSNHSTNNRLFAVAVALVMIDAIFVSSAAISRSGPMCKGKVVGNTPGKQREGFHGKM